MDKIYLDTNIIIDSLLKREPFNQYSDKLISIADNGKIRIVASAISFVSANFIISKNIGKLEAREKLRKFRIICEVTSLTEKIIDKGLNSEIKDIEDAYQYFSALESDSSAIITRNKKDFKNSSIPVYTAEEYLHILSK